MNSPISRRRFMTLSAAGSAGLVVLPSRLARGFAANEKIQVGLIGVGGRGRWFVDTIPRLEQVVALCDVNEQKIDEAFKHWKEAGRRYAASPHEWERRAGAEFARLLESPPEVFHDFRQMIERMGKRLDAVVVATPDHTHAVASAAAMHEGKHVFCEKPLTRTVEESRRLRQLAREKKVATSMGNQGTYSGPFRRALELIRHGTIGRVEEVYVWNSGGGADRKQPPQSELPVPPYLHWDLWLGPAAFRPYHPDWMKRNLWREFGTCQLGNWGSHSANLAFMSLKVHHLWLDPPGAVRTTIKVSARSSGINRLSFPRWEAVDWEIPARADLPRLPSTGSTAGHQDSRTCSTEPSRAAATTSDADGNGPARSSWAPRAPFTPRATTCGSGCCPSANLPACSVSARRLWKRRAGRSRTGSGRVGVGRVPGPISIMLPRSMSS